MVILDDADADEEDNQGSHTEYNCACVSYLQKSEGPGSDGIGDGDGNIPWPKPPGGGIFVPGNPYTECVDEANKAYDRCMKAADINPDAARDLPDNELAELTAANAVAEKRCMSAWSKAYQQCTAANARWEGRCVFCLNSIANIDLH